MLLHGKNCVEFHLKCQSRMKIPSLEVYKAASLASDAVEPGAVFWRVLGNEVEAKELDLFVPRPLASLGTSSAALWAPVHHARVGIFQPALWGFLRRR